MIALAALALVAAADGGVVTLPFAADDVHVSNDRPTVAIVDALNARRNALAACVGPRPDGAPRDLVVVFDAGGRAWGAFVDGAANACVEAQFAEAATFAPTGGHVIARLRTRPRPAREADVRRAGLGSIPAETIRAIVRTKQGAVRFCFEEARKRSSKVAGKVVVQWVIGADGRTQATTIASSDIPDEAVGACLLVRVKTWTFPPPKNGGIVIVNYPFVLAPSPVDGGAR